MLKRPLAVTALLLASTSAADAATITFDSLPGANLDVFSAPYSEGGFDVTPTSGIIKVAKLFGNPVPDLVVGGFAGSTVSSFTVSAGKKLFSLNSFELALQGATNNYTVTGYLGGVPTVLLDTAVIGGGFQTIFSGSTAQFDSVSFGFYVPGPSSSINIDNIGLTIAAVPEPATWAMMMIGLGAVGFSMRSRRSQVRTTVAYA